MLEAITYVGIDEKRPDPEQDKGKRVIPGGVVKLITGRGPGVQHKERGQLGIRAVTPFIRGHRSFA